MTQPAREDRLGNEQPYGPVTREGILREAQRLHDLRYGTAHCDRKYVQVCGRFQEALFESSENLRARPTPPAAEADMSAGGL